VLEAWSSRKASWSPFGAGRAGSGGTPQLALVTGQTPRLGASLGLVLTGLPAAAPGRLYLGATFWTQAVVLDPPANGLGLTMSNAGVGLVGT
jgi:hypothetical protein